jgi:acetyltransferase-like isoleucine patch superfamily enzyme
MADGKLTVIGVLRRSRRLESMARAQWWRALHPGITVGPGVRIGRGCRLFVDPQATLILGRACEIDDATTIAVYGTGRIELGAGSFVGHHCTLAAHDSIEIGSGTYLAELVSIRDHDHLPDAPPSSGELKVAPVTIGADVWIGAKATVIRGTRIGDGTVVGANAVARGELPAHTVCAGVPARVIRTLDPVGRTLDPGSATT